jgi:threonylcarbamoyladenosine tRNA methylthiotransferase MtaB
MDDRPCVAFYTLGCKLNQAETEALANQFGQAGFRVASDDGADVCILNTCTVTHIADRKSRHLLRLLRKKNPKALIVATGCYAERAPKDISALKVDLVIGNEQKTDIPELVKKRLDFKADKSGVEFESPSVSRVRSFIKIQEGCNDYCSYCIVPIVRGHRRCLPAEGIIDMVKAKVAMGYKEVILTGTKIGDYSDNGAGLQQLIVRILEQTDLKRLHLSSLQPQEITGNLISLWTNSRLCRHFHVALQSGSDTVLERMKRRYNLEDYSKAISWIKKEIPDVAVTTDIMVGFPGETDAEFEENYSFCRDMGFADIHVFSYSCRTGTKAAQMSDQVNEKGKKARSLRMLDLARESARSFQERFLGQTIGVLWEAEVKPGSGLYTGFSDNYMRVFAKSDRRLSNRIVRVKLIKAYNDGVWGEIVL